MVGQVRTQLERATRAKQSVNADWEPVEPITIDGVEVKEIRNVVIRSGVLTESYRPEWFAADMRAEHVVHMRLIAGAFHRGTVTVSRAT